MNALTDLTGLEWSQARDILREAGFEGQAVQVLDATPPAERLARYVVYFFMVAAVVISVQSIEIIPEFLYDAPAQIQDFFLRMWPIDRFMTIRYSHV